MEFSGQYDVGVDPGSLDYTISVQPLEKPRRLYGGKLYIFEGAVTRFELNGTKTLVEGRRTFEMWFPITDRRVARRIARDRQMRFKKMRDKTYVFTKKRSESTN